MKHGRGDSDRQPIQQLINSLDCTEKLPVIFIVIVFWGKAIVSQIATRIGQERLKKKWNVPVIDVTYESSIGRIVEN